MVSDLTPTSKRSKIVTLSEDTEMSLRVIAKKCVSTVSLIVNQYPVEDS